MPAPAVPEPRTEAVDTHADRDPAADAEPSAGTDDRVAAAVTASETPGATTAAGTDPRPRTLRLVPPVSDVPVSGAPVSVPVSATPTSEVRTAGSPESDDVPAVGEPVPDVAAAAPAVAIPAQRIPVAEPIRDRRAGTFAVPGAGGADVALRHTFGLLGPAPDGEPAITLSGTADADPPQFDDGTATPQSVRFRVTRPDGSTVPGAAITLVDDHGRVSGTGYADVRGHGEIRAPHAGRYLLIGTAPGHRPGAATVSTVDGHADAEVSLARSAALSGSIRGTRGPIAGATVTLVQDGEIIDAARSGIGGMYRLQELDAGGYGLSVAAEGWAPIAVLLDIGGGVDVHRDVELAPALGSTSDKPRLQERATVDRKVVGGH